jgi:hypothetical protein
VVDVREEKNLLLIYHDLSDKKGVNHTKIFIKGKNKTLKEKLPTQNQQTFIIFPSSK